MAGLLVSLPLEDPWRLRLPFLVAAAFSTVAWLLVWRRLPESRPADMARTAHANEGLRRGLLDLLGDRRIGGLVLVGSVVGLAFSALEGTFSLFLGHRMGWSTNQAAFCFAYIGVIGILVQGGLIRWLIPRFGEPRLIAAGLISLLLGFVGLALVDRLAPLLAAILLVGLGHGVATPAISGLLSRLTPPAEQGAVFGIYTSLQTLARMINYIAAAVLLGGYGPSAPYWEGALLLALALVFTSIFVRGSRASLTDATRHETGIDPVTAPAP
jgi:DHA1 family tetracycline resistance protein-like MFS transporter